MFCVILDDNYCEDANSVLIHGVSGISLKVFGQGDGAGQLVLHEVEREPIS